MKAVKLIVLLWFIETGQDYNGPYDEHNPICPDKIIIYSDYRLYEKDQWDISEEEIECPCHCDNEYQ